MSGIAAPKVIALVGASARNPELIENVQRGGTVALGVHPQKSDVLGLRTVPTLGDLDEIPDLAVLAVGARSIIDVLKDGLELGIRSFVVPGLGVEAGHERQAVTAQLCELADPAGAALLGPNCMGIASPRDGSAWLGTIPCTFLPGPVAVVSQSGSIADAFVALGPRLGFSHVVSTGSEANRDAADWLKYFATDSASRVIALFLETVRRPVAFRAALEALAAAGKPVVCLKVGRSEQAAEAALAHTGAIVGSHTAFSALLETHGALEVGDLPEMIELLSAISQPSRPRGTRIGAITESGAEAALLSDHAERHGLTFPPLPEETRRKLREEIPSLPLSNPVDPWALDEPVRAFTVSLAALAGSQAYDIVLAQVDLSRFRGASEQRWCSAVVRALAAERERHGTFVAVTTVHQTDPPDALAEYALTNGVALFKGVGSGLSALARAASWTPRSEKQPEPRQLHSSIWMSSKLSTPARCPRMSPRACSSVPVCVSQSAPARTRRPRPPTSLPGSASRS